MKLIISILLVALSCISSTYLKSKGGKELKIYSMVWSAKHYTGITPKDSGKEVKDFFFAVPFSFNTVMTLDTTKKSFSFKFPGIDSDKANAGLLKTELAANSRNTEWSQFVKVNSDYKSVELSLDFKSNPKYEVSRIRTYNNQTFKSLEVKLFNTTSPTKAALYVTFDFDKTVTDGDRESVINFFKTNWPKAKLA
jgi:hypothetical protein